MPYTPELKASRIPAYCNQGRNVSFLSLHFQIQTRLQNLGNNLQNKSNDIEVLAVSECFFPF